MSIVNYFKNNFNLALIGAHGESLGGAFAAHMAYKCNLDFVFVDRCFAGVDSIAKYNVHKYTHPLFLLTYGGKDGKVFEDYMYSSSYKVVSCDF